jgi:hypothetical protein
MLTVEGALKMGPYKSILCKPESIPCKPEALPKPWYLMLDDLFITVRQQAHSIISERYTRHIYIFMRSKINLSLDLD